MTNADLGGPEVRKLRLGVMGEFSAGKSTLCNLLLGARPLTERVTATRLSPVWISQGQSALEREFLDGHREPVALEDLESVPIKDTRSLRLYDEADVLEMFDLIDFPGISDPNMPTEVWERLVPEIDAILWCTHANQAWRQSEAEVWRAIPDDVKVRSLLLITRFDTITNERDRSRVLARVQHETRGEFGGIFPISLTQALAGGEDPDLWEKSGAEPFTAYLIEMIAGLQTELERGLIAEREAYVEREAEENDARPDAVAPEPVEPPASRYADEFGEGLEPVEAPATSLRVQHPPREDALPAVRTDAVEEEAPSFDAFDLDDVDHFEASEIYPEAEPVAEPVAERSAALDAEPAPKPKSPISLMPKRTKHAADATDEGGVIPRRVRPTGHRRTERPRGEAAVRSLRMDELKEDGDLRSATPEDLRAALSSN